MSELEARLSKARTQLTELLQDARAGRRPQVLLGLIALSSELLSIVVEQTADQLCTRVKRMPDGSHGKQRDLAGSDTAGRD